MSISETVVRLLPAATFTTAAAGGAIFAAERTQYPIEGVPSMFETAASAAAVAGVTLGAVVVGSALTSAGARSIGLGLIGGGLGAAAGGAYTLFFREPPKEEIPGADGTGGPFTGSAEAIEKVRSERGLPVNPGGGAGSGGGGGGAWGPGDHIIDDHPSVGIVPDDTEPIVRRELPEAVKGIGGDLFGENLSPRGSLGGGGGAWGPEDEFGTADGHEPGPAPETGTGTKPAPQPNADPGGGGIGGFLGGIGNAIGGTLEQIQAGRGSLTENNPNPESDTEPIGNAW